MTDALRNIQSKLNAPKNLYNKFGGYKYRSCESILEAVKPLLAEYGAEVVLTDSIVNMGDRFYVKATAIFTCDDDQVIVSAYAREPASKKGMDESQITGTASSYARKYALNGLFLIDDAKDPDTDEHQIEREARAEAEKPTDPKVKEDNIKKLEALASEAGVEMKVICKWANVRKVEDMSMTKWASACRKLQKTIEEAEKNV